MCERVIARVDDAGDVEARVRSRVSAGHILCAVQRMDRASICLTEAETIAGSNEALMKAVLVAARRAGHAAGGLQAGLRAPDRLKEIVTKARRPDGEAQDRWSNSPRRSRRWATVRRRSRLERAEGFLRDDVMAACERQKVRSPDRVFLARLPSRRGVASRGGHEPAPRWPLLRGRGEPPQPRGRAHPPQRLPRAYGAIRQSLALCDECGYERLGS